MTGRVPMGRWTWANLRHAALALRLGRNPASTVYESIGTDVFAALSPGWLNVGLWDGPGTAREAAEAAPRLTAALAEALPAGGRIVHVGNGLGVADPLIAGVVAPRWLVPVNIAESQLRAGRSHLDRAGAWPVVGDACRLPLGDGCADGVISVEAAFHFTSRAAFLREVRRVLRPGGVLTMSDVAVERGARTPAELAAGVFNLRFWGVRRSNLASSERIAQLAREAGLVDVVVERCGERTIDPFVRYSGARTDPAWRSAPAVQRLTGRVMLRQWRLMRRRAMVDYVLVKARAPG